MSKATKRIRYICTNALLRGKPVHCTSDPRCRLYQIHRFAGSPSLLLPITIAICVPGGGYIVRSADCLPQLPFGKPEAPHALRPKCGALRHSAAASMAHVPAGSAYSSSLKRQCFMAAGTPALGLAPLLSKASQAMCSGRYAPVQTLLQKCQPAQCTGAPPGP